MSRLSIHVTAADGSTRTLDAKTGRSLMKAAIDAGVDGIAADCGGCLTCATCHVIVAPEWASKLPPASADERSMLEMTASPAEPTSRLSCQIELTAALDGLAVRLPATQY